MVITFDGVLAIIALSFLVETMILIGIYFEKIWNALSSKGSKFYNSIFAMTIFILIMGFLISAIYPSSDKEIGIGITAGFVSGVAVLILQKGLETERIVQ